MTALAAIILAGGASRRMGADKGSIVWNGRRAVDRVADLAFAAGARALIVAGRDYGYPFVLDTSPQAGPVGGLIAAAPGLRAQGFDRALVLAIDAPTLRLEDLKPLLVLAPPGGAYIALPLPMVLSLAAIPADALPDWPLRRLVEAAGLALLISSKGASDRLRGANTPIEREHLLFDFVQRDSGSRKSSVDAR
jgi:molybdopterin-guanine dinucleotide biosynthesis protein A